MDERQWFTDQVLACQTGMYRLAMSLLRNPEDAADAAQEAILIAYEKLPDLRSRDRFRPWLMRILVHQCYAILRRRTCSQEVEQTADNPADQWEDNQSLWQAVNALNEGLRSVVVLFYYEDFSVRETAAVLGITEANVKTRLSRARKCLKRALEDDYESG